MTGERALSDADAIVWTIERDPALRSTIIGLAVLDRAPDVDVLRRRVEHASRLVPKLRQVVRATTPDGGSPVWVTVASLDLDYHVRRVRCPEPGTMAEVLRIAEAAATRAFDPARPLFEMLLVEGLADGRSVLVLKVHHAITDGLGAFQIAAHLVDLERDAEPQPMPHPPAPDMASGLQLALESATERLQSSGARLVEVVAAARRRLAAAATDPASVTEVVGQLPGVARLVAPATARRSPLFTNPASLSWRMDVLDVPLHALKGGAKAVGGTLNDAFLAVVSGGLQRYHEQLGAPVSALRTTMPVSVRTGTDREAGNRFTPVRFDLPTDITDPAKRLRELGRLAAERRADPALGVADTLAAVLNGLPAPMVTAVFGGMLKGVDLVASNVPGSPAPMYLAGSRIERLYPFAPPTGSALSVTLVSHDGTCCIGVQVDPANVTEPDRLITCLRDAIDEIVALGAS